MASVHYSTKDDDDMLDFTEIDPLSRPSDHTYLSLNYYNPYTPPRNRHLAARFIQNPVVTTLSSFSKFANLLLRPHEEQEDEHWDTISQLTKSIDIYDGNSTNDKLNVPLPPPALPNIISTSQQCRQKPLSVREYKEDGTKWSQKDLALRVFQGGLADSESRRYFWPVILGLFESPEDPDWSEYKDLYAHYNVQWNSILPDQEMRFTSFRERKSLIERDVIRCDRSHEFYKDSEENLDKLKSLLMTYMMYDFDTGYVQGMTDLAAPLLYVFEGDVIKSFWCFVQIMKFYRNNFEMSQNTIRKQLQYIWKSIKVTDPCFAQYLGANESSNCYFTFRWIVCQFKREFMKRGTDEYHDCLIVWEAIWSSYLLTKLNTCTRDQEITTKKETNSNNSNNDDAKLEEVEIYVLALSLAIIRRERDIIMANGYDACDILKHFNMLQLNDSLGDILLHAATIWSWLKNDGGEALLYEETVSLQNPEGNEDFDLLNDVECLINSSSI